jgi:ATP-binding cassette subfamily F protein 3
VRSLEWLEETLSSLDAAVILVAHDRWFLEAVATAVLELEAGRSLFFRGPWHEWRREKAARAIAAGKAVARHEVDIARLERFVERFRYKKRKARQAQAKLTQIARLEKERAKVAGELDSLTKRSKSLGFDFLKPPRSGRTVVFVEGLDVAAGDKPLLSDVTFAIDRGEHVGLVGPNGSGKTTLLEALLAGQLGYGVIPAYFSQQGTELDERGSVLDCAQRATGLQRPQAQTLLGRFLFSGWDMHERPVTALSGGERRRLSLALLVASGANFLVLDEPTNHLDLESREALEEALEAFPGTVLLVSHDRAVLDAVARRTLAIEDGTVRSYDGGWADYARLSAERAEERSQEQSPVVSSRATKAPSELRAGRPRAIVELEAAIESKESDVAELERRLADDWANVEAAAAYRHAREELEGLLARWELLFDQTSA